MSTVEPLLTIDPRRGFGRVCIANTRTPADAIAGCVAAGDSVDEVAEDYGVTRQDVLLCCMWYQWDCARENRKWERALAAAWEAWAADAASILGGHRPGPLEDPPDVADGPNPGPVVAIKKWLTNGHLIADAARLGYLPEDGPVLDCTYGYGTFWKVWQPKLLVRTDLVPAKSPDAPTGVDFRNLPWQNRHFKASVFDGPYKFNGTATDTGGIDERFGVHERSSWEDRMQLLVDGAREVARVTDEHLLVKCQDQVVCSKIRWQTRVIEGAVTELGFGLKDRFEFLSYRAQPGDRTQRNAHRGSSQLLVFKRGWRSDV